MNFEIKMIFKHSCEEIFEISQDYSKRLEWDPFLKSADLINATSPRVGVIARCVSKLGQKMDVEYVSYRPPHVTAVRMIGGPSLISYFTGTWKFRRLDDNQTEVTFHYDLETRPKLLEFLIWPLAWSYFQYESQKRLQALANYMNEHSEAKTGHLVE